MTFQFGTPPDPDKRASWNYITTAKRLMIMTKTVDYLLASQCLNTGFVINVCDVLLGEDAMYKYSPRELYEKLQEMSETHRLKLEEEERV